MKINIDELLGNPTQDYEIFHKKVKAKKSGRLLSIEDWPKAWKTTYFKGYARFEEIYLTKPSLPKISLNQSLEGRKSSKSYDNKAIPLKKLSSLLYFSAGLKKKDNVNSGRFYPSAGGRYPLEVYFLSLNTELPRGLYHYYLKHHSLEKLRDIDKINLNDYLIHDDTKNTACYIIVTGIFRRSTNKYGDRGYNYSYIELGALMQNLYLNANALDLGICALGSFVHDKFNELIDIKEVVESTMLVFSIGNLIDNKE